MLKFSSPATCAKECERRGIGDQRNEATKKQDLAAVDRGRLKRWSLDLSGQVTTSTTVEDTPGVIIPDNTEGGIERSLTVAGTGLLQSIEAEVDISHTFIGDLVIELISPNGTSVLLHNRTGGLADNIIRTYTAGNTLGLRALQGETIGGAWKLRVWDHASQDQGKLNRWALKLT